MISTKCYLCRVRTKSTDGDDEGQVAGDQAMACGGWHRWEWKPYINIRLISEPVLKVRVFIRDPGSG